MFRIIKVTGESLSPEFQEGDFVLTAKIPFLFSSFQQGDILVFKHPDYGRLIKIVDRVENDATAYFVVGTHPNSLDSHRLGLIKQENIIGKVIWHVKKPVS
jgi:signal peptidase I